MIKKTRIELGLSQLSWPAAPECSSLGPLNGLGPWAQRGLWR